MALRLPQLDKLRDALGELRAALPPQVLPVVDRWNGDAAALAYHLDRQRERRPHPALVAVLGGTGTGKSTLVNRLLEANVSATSFRRTYTAGPVAIAADPGQIPEGWMGLERKVATGTELPARGQPDLLMIAQTGQPLAEKVTVLDTPDLDGDTPVHHVQADRVFRWAEALLFLVTPEKYQMTELLPYYRLAQRYGVAALFAMNKAEETAVVQDYTKQMADRGWPEIRLFAIPRDDAAWSSPEGMDLGALRQSIAALAPTESESGLANRTADVLSRLTDQVIAPLRQDRREADRLKGVLQAMESPEPGVDVHPMTQQLQRRLQQRSVLYLMGPGRMLERARQVPGLLVRLPRTLWDTVVRGKTVTLNAPAAQQAENKVPDFRANLIEQFTVVQSRIDDALRTGPIPEKWLTERKESYAATRIDPNDAGKIADEELAALRNWLEKRWNATPRDTALILRLLKHLPGGERFVHWIEATPYLVAVLLAAQHMVSHGADLMIIGGFSLATWIGEKLSNEVTNRVRETNQRIEQRFGELAHEQIKRTSEWLEQQAPAEKALSRIELLAEEIADEAEERISDEGGSAARS